MLGVDGILTRLHVAVATRVVPDRPKERPSSCLKGHQESTFQAGRCTPSRSVSGEGGGSGHAILDEKKSRMKREARERARALLFCGGFERCGSGPEAS